MRDAYGRITRELVHRGYTVVPDVATDIPWDSSALQFIDAELARAELSVHLLGTKSGYSPEDLPAITPLQLRRAAARLATEAVKGRVGFRRILWAPKDFGIIGAKAGDEVARDPLVVIDQFDRQLPSDRVVGDTLSQFVDFLVWHLVRTEPVPPHRDDPPPRCTGQIYLNYSQVDADYAFTLADVFSQRGVEVIVAEVDGTELELKAFHQQNLQECDAVAVCWATASAVSVRSLAFELRDWHALGRTQPFAFRGVVAGPPPGTRKKGIRHLFPKSMVDVALDLTSTAAPTPDQLDPLISNTVSHVS